MISPEQQTKLAKGIGVYLTMPFNPTVSGPAWENIFAYAVGGEVAGTGSTKKGAKTLFDVVRGDVGWSLKTLLSSPSKDSYEFVIKRANVLGKYGLSLTDGPAVLAEHIVRDRNEEFIRSMEVQGIRDARVGILLRDRPQRRFVYWEESYGEFDIGAYSWDWGSLEKKSVVGRDVKGSIKFRWYQSGAQLFEIFRVPRDSLRFSVDVSPQSVDELYEKMGYGSDDVELDRP